MAFHDIRLPEDVEKGAQGGPRFKTTVFTLSSGKEKRNIDWERVRGAWDIGYGIETKANFVRVRDFYYARQGMAHSFRYKDFADFEVGDPATSTPQSIGTGDAVKTAFQIFKRYTSGAVNFDRTTEKPVSGTVRPFLNGVEQMSGWTVNTSTGVVTFTTAPGAGVAVAVICEFDVPVRFDTDSLDIVLQTLDAGGVPNLPIIEVRGE